MLASIRKQILTEDFYTNRKTWPKGGYYLNSCVQAQYSPKWCMGLHHLAENWAAPPPASKAGCKAGALSTSRAAKLCRRLPTCYGSLEAEWRKAVQAGELLAYQVLPNAAAERKQVQEH